MSTLPDLSLRHEPISTLFQDHDQVGPDTSQLTEQQRQQFEEQGFLAGIPVLTADQVDALRDELTEFMKPDHHGSGLWHEYHANESADPNAVLFHALGAWRLGTAFHDLLWCPAFVKVAEQLVAGPVRFWHDQLFCKPAHHGGVVAWHQDYSYWTRTKPMAHLTCWIALDDADEANGCIQYVPGSHQWDLLPITGLAGDMDAIRKTLDDDQWEQMQNPVCHPLRAGEASFHHCLTVHGSSENRTRRPRRAAVINVIRDGVCSATDEPLLQGVPRSLLEVL